MAHDNRYKNGDSDNVILRKILRTLQVAAGQDEQAPGPNSTSNDILADILMFLQGQ